MVPFAIDMALLFVLIIMSFSTSGTPQESIILILVFIPLAFLFLELTVRKTVVDLEGIKIRKFLRKKELQWRDITNVDLMIVRKKVYLLLTSTKGFHVLSSAYADFTNLVHDIIRGAGDDKVEERVQEIFQSPVKRIADAVTAWFAVVILIGIIYLKLFS